MADPSRRSIPPLAIIGALSGLVVVGLMLLAAFSPRTGDDRQASDGPSAAGQSDTSGGAPPVRSIPFEVIPPSPSAAAPRATSCSASIESRSTSAETAEAFRSDDGFYGVWEGVEDRPSERWTHVVHGDAHSVSISDDAVALSTRDADGAWGIRLLDRDTGELRWERSIPGDVVVVTVNVGDSGVVAAQVGPEPGSVITLYDVDDGAPLQTRTTRNEYGFENPSVLQDIFGDLLLGELEVATVTEAGLVVRDFEEWLGATSEHLVLQSHGHVQAVDLESLDVANDAVCAPDSEAATVHEGRLVVSDGDALTAYDAAGEALWSNTTGVSDVHWVASAGSGRLVLVGDDAYEYWAVSDDAGQPVWRSEIDGDADLDGLIRHDGDVVAVLVDDAFGELTLPLDDAEPAPNVVELIELTDDGPQLLGTHERPTTDDEPIVTRQVVYEQWDDDQGDDGEIAYLEARVLPALDRGWRLSVGGGGLDGGFEVVDGAVFGVERADGAVSVTLFE